MDKPATIKNDARMNSNASTISRYANRQYLVPTNRDIDHKTIRALAQDGPYKIDQILARGAESVLYTGKISGHTVCIKAVRNWVNKWIGDSMTRNQEEKLESVQYHTKIRHIENEYEVSKKLYSNEDIPVVHIYGLRQVKSLGFEVGKDLIMEYIDGHDLADKVIARTLTLEDKLSVFAQSVNALAYLHRKNLIHLDIKPSNFMLTTKGKVKILDFGVSVISGWRPKAITGTGGYLSPEQICKEQLEATTDIFAIGMAFNVFFGGKPINQPQNQLLLKQTRIDAKYHLEHDDQSILTEMPELNELPKIAALIRQCAIPRRDMRPQSCEIILSQLREYCSEYGIELRNV